VVKAFASISALIGRSVGSSQFYGTVNISFVIGNVTELRSDQLCVPAVRIVAFQRSETLGFTIRHYGSYMYHLL
jgi:hypothetical protein